MAAAPESSDTTAPSRAHGSIWEWMRTALLAADILWTTLCLGGFLPGSRVLMAILTAVLLAVHFSDPVRGVRCHPAGLLFLPFLAYGAANCAWITPVRWLGWTDWLNWAQAVAIFWVVLNGIEAPSCRRFLCAGLAALGVLAALLAIYQHFVRPDWLMLGRRQAAQFIGRSSGPFGIPNSLGGLMALLIPPVGYVALVRGSPVPVRVFCGVALCALATGFVLAISRGAWISLALALSLGPLLSPGLGIGRRICAAAASVAAIAAAALILYFGFPLMHTRVDQFIRDAGEKLRPILWRASWKLFEDNPVLGGGAGSFDVLFERYRPEGCRDQPIYAHCDYLNTLSDYGAVGFALLFGAAAVVAWKGAKGRGLAGAAFLGLLAFALHLFVDFHLKIPALAMIAATIAALVARETWPAPAAPRGAGYGAARIVALCVAAAAAVSTCLWIVPKYRGEEFRRAAREKIDRMAYSGSDVSGQGPALSAIRAGLSRAVGLDPSNAQAWSDKAYAETLEALVEPARTGELGRAASGDAGRALALCPVVAEFWIRKGQGLDMQGRWIDGGDCMVRALQIASMRADVWYYQAYHLSLFANETGPAMAAADVALRLDPGFLLAQSLRQRLATRLQ